jgi:hypothetical protein
MSAVIDLLDKNDCVESSGPGARWFIWRVVPDHFHVMRTTRGASAKVTGSYKPIPAMAIDLVLHALGSTKSAATLKWAPCEPAVPRSVMARLPHTLAQRLVDGTQT